MSEFDKEAERRRLREKYESESEDRETTERMSQLLLQGATMTNHHCDDCGSPIFRYQGQEFCPTCQAEAQDAAQQGGQQAGQQDGQQTGQQAGSEAAQAGAGATEQPHEQGQQTPDQPEPTQGPTSQEATPSQQDTTSQQDKPPQQDPSSQQTPRPPQGTRPNAQGAGTADLSDAGAALAASITTLAARAEQTNDPRLAKEFLEAAHEAAEALAALQS